MNHLQVSMISLPRPKISATDKRLTFTALGSQGFVPMNDNNNYNNNNNNNNNNNENIGQTNDGSYFARQWGSHPDIHSFDLRSQNSSAAYSENTNKNNNNNSNKSKGSDSRFDSRYNDVVSQDGSINTQ